MILLMNVDKDNPSVAEGENIQIQGAGLTGFELKGNTEQDSYTGKNLSYFNRMSANGITFEGNDIDVLNPTHYLYVDVWNLKNNSSLSGKTYTVYSLTNGTTGEKALEFNIGKTGNSYAYQHKLSANTTYTNNLKVATVTLGENEVFTYASLYVNGSTTANLNIKVMIVEGSYTEQTIGDYEPYVGGIPSPNPDYPQPIEVVTGDNTINVHGKNLIYKSIDVNTISSTGKIEGYDDVKVNVAKVVSGKSYTYSSSINEFIVIGFFDEEPTINSVTYNGSREVYQVSKKTFIVPEGCNYVGIRSGLNTIPMLNEGDTALPYEPYQSKDYEINLGNIELCKIGDYQDYIYKENNKWYKHSEIGKVVYNGTETGWSGSVVTTGVFRAFRAFNNILPYGDTSRHGDRILSNYFNPNLNNEVGAMYQYQNQVLFCTDATITPTTEDFKTWLSTHNMILYYVLATPTNTEITDTELKEDLEAISNIALFEGVNNISMESSNLTSSFKVYYDTWYEFDKILRNGYNIREDRDRITQKFANGHRKQFVSDYVDCSITLNLDTIDKDTTQDYLQRLKSGAYKYYSIDGKEYRTAQFIIENKPELSVESSISNNVDVNEYQITLLKAGD